jgi:bacillithiol biosynthesis deacetylase BshB1
MLDILVFAAHPDDAEIGMAGTITRLSKLGYKIGIVDLTAGEMGTRGNAKLRRKEASAAAEIMNVEFRENLGLPDGNIKLNDEFTKKIVVKIRQHKPKIIFSNYFNDRHPDHKGTAENVKEAFFYCGVQKYKTKLNNKAQQMYRPKKLFYYMNAYEFKPAFIFDISETFKQKQDALAAYGTQFYNPKSESKEPETFISQPAFIKMIEARARVYGFKIRKEYGEPFYCEEDIELDFTNLLGK